MKSSIKIWDERKLRKDILPYDFQIFSETVPKDTTGRSTGNNELKMIEKELTRFITKVIDDE